MSSTTQETVTVDTFLYQALAEMNELDVPLLAEQLYTYIIARDGSCSYSIAEIEACMNESDCLE